jgi:hypothetical protein
MSGKQIFTRRRHLIPLAFFYLVVAVCFVVVVHAELCCTTSFTVGCGCFEVVVGFDRSAIATS